jgi:hypothetical protein
MKSSIFLIKIRFHRKTTLPICLGLDNSDNFSDNRVVRCCPKPKKYLILLVELSGIEPPTS